MAEGENNSEFYAHASFLTLMVPDRTAGLRRDIVRGADVKQQHTGAPETESSGGFVDTVKSYLGLDANTGASAQETASSAATQVTSTVAAAADTYLPESIKPEAVKGAAAAATDGTAAEAAAGGASSDDAKPADPTTDKSEDGTEPAAGTEGDASKDSNTADSSAKKPAPSGGRSLENRDAIPTAGGKKLGEEHWGESKIVPDVPKAAEDEPSSGGVASAAGQPTDEVKQNTAQNTGAATGPPQAASSESSSAAASPARSGTDGEKKGKLMDRLKSKFKKDKA